MSKDTSDTNRYGEIVNSLLSDSYISHEQLVYAERVQQKLSSEKNLLDVLKELNYLSGEDIQEAIRSSHLSMRIGDLLVEIGLLSKSKLEAAFDIQKAEGRGKNLEKFLLSKSLYQKKNFMRPFHFN